MGIQNVVKAVMSTKEMSARDVAKKTGLSVTFITSIRAGKRNISLTNFQKLAEAFDMKSTDLMRLVELNEEGKTYQELMIICIESMKNGIRIYGNY